MRTVLVAVLLVYGTVIGLRLARGGTLPRLVVGGIRAGGVGEAELRRRVRDLAERKAESPLTFAVAGVPVEPLSATDGEAGYRLDVEATVRRAMGRGRQANPLRALADHLRAGLGPVHVAPVERIDARRLALWARDASARLSRTPVEGDLRFEGVTVTPVYPSRGWRVDEGELRSKALAAIRRAGPDAVTLDAETIVPATSAADVDRVLEAARLALSAPVRLRRGETALTVPPAQLAALLEVERPGSGAPEPRLRLKVNRDRMSQILGGELSRFDSGAADARIEPRGDAVRIVPSREGFRVQPEALAVRLVELASSTDSREGELPGEAVAPAFTTEQAQALNITRKVSGFTTRHRCCEPRVENIHRIADILDGRIVRPGETFSLNAAAGQRTPENGFIPAPSIRDGEFVDEVGGGVSQFATTIFNAIFFGGYDILEHQPHSYYISRYPRGREATVSWPSPDLKFRNDSAAGILIDTSYTGTSVTVSFYGTTDIAVEAVMGEPANQKEPDLECRPNPAIPPGETRVVQEGRQGFDVVVERVLTHPDGRQDRERFFTRYRPEKRIVEAASCPQ